MTPRLIFMILIDSLLAYAAFFSAVVMRLGFNAPAAEFLNTTEFRMSSAFVAVNLFSSQLMDVYDLAKNTRKREIFINTVLAAITSFISLSIAYYLVPTAMTGSGVIAIAIILLVLYQFPFHSIYLMCRKNPRFAIRTLVLGTGQLANQMGQLAETSNSTFCLAGYASCPEFDKTRPECEKNTMHVPAKSIIGSSDDLMAAALQARADLIVVALFERRGVFPLRDVLRCKLNGIEIMDAPSFYERVHHKLMLENITPGWFIFSSGFRRTALLIYLKRFSDIMLSSIGLLLAAPLFPVIAFVIRLDSPGPIFFNQVRVGCRERLFKLYKFRTMRTDAEESSGAVWAQKNDPRVTRLGAFLRKSRLDELPQLYNVLIGDMSFIGPRPERPEFVEELKKQIPYYSKRHFIKPGLTGWAQVKYPYGASIEDAIEKLRYDLFYIKHLSAFLDLLILFETVKVVLFGRGAR